MALKLAELRALFEQAPQPCVLTDAKLRILAANEAVCVLSGFTAQALQDRHLADLLSPEEAMRLGAVCDRGVGPHYLVARGRRKKGPEYRAELRLKRLLIGGEEHWLATVTDSSASHDALEALRRNEAEYRQMVEASPDGMALLSDGGVAFANGAMEALLGLGGPDELWGTDFEGHVHPDDQGAYREAAARALKGEQTQQQELRARLPEKQPAELELSCQRLERPEGPALLLLVRDLRPRKEMERRLRESEDAVRVQTWHDALTGLPNRSLLLERLEQALKQAARDGSRLALLHLDLDRFKLVNDSLGHGAGDEVLKEAARRLEELLRKGDTVARLGGDEFCVLLADLTREDAAVAVGRKIVAALSESFHVRGQNLHFGASVGLAFYPEHGAEPERLMKQADMAMYRAKLSGRGQVALYSENLEEKQEQRLTLENELRRGIEQGELRLHFQPQLDLGTGRITGAEALVRWQHPQRGLLGPDEFIPLAEDSRLILPLGEWVLRQSCLAAAAWKRRVDPGVSLSVAVNLSVWQLNKRNLLKTVEAALEASGLDPQNLELEITETVAMRNPEQTLEILKSFTERGVRLSLDDFGKGYSSLNYLKDFPVHAIKIDRAFVSGLPGSLKDAAIVKAIIALAHNLGLRCLAEGIETPEQRDILRREGCDLAQGYLFSRPVPGDAFEALLMKGFAGAS